MFDLRTRLKALHERFGATGMVVAVIALVVALGGTALATGGFTSKQKKEIEKIAKKFAGKPGAVGPQGPAGAPGANGTAGAVGAQGATGLQGPTGPQGATGPKGATGATGPEGEAGATGASGATGPAGPVVYGQLLPKGQTVMGEINVDKREFGEANAVASLAPFTVPSEEILDLLFEEHWIQVPISESSTPGAVTGCPGTYEDPQADPGYICFYWVERLGGVKEEVNVQCAFCWTPNSIPLRVEANSPAGHGLVNWAFQRFE
jgi:hypothetical protein